MRRLCDVHGAALLVDESHALGVLGPEGRGLCAAVGRRARRPRRHVRKGVRGRAGRSSAGCPSLVTWLWNRARSFVFSTGLSPAVAGRRARGHAHGARRSPIAASERSAAARQLREGLLRVGVRPLGYGHIVPWVVGEPAAAVRASEALQAEGIDVRAIRPPSVPAGTARLRFAMSASHQGADIERVVGAVSRVLVRRLG